MSATAEDPVVSLDRSRLTPGPAEPSAGLASPRFEDLAESFLAYQLIYTRTQRTVRSNLRILKRHFGPMVVTEIGTKEIQAFIAARIGGGVGKPTINRNRSCLSTFFTWAIEQGYHPGPNPVRLVRKFREAKGRLRYLTTDEYQRLLLVAAHHLKAILVTAVHTGGRLSELLGLRWADIDLEHGLVYFRRETTKSGKERSVPIHQDLDTVLRDLRPGRPSDPVFSWAGQPLRSVRTSFESARLKAGLGGDVLFHTLRHTFASWYIENGGDPKRLQEYLGHSTLEQTLIYIHLSPLFRSEGVRFIGPPPNRSAEQDGQGTCLPRATAPGRTPPAELLAAGGRPPTESRAARAPIGFVQPAKEGREP